VLSVTFDGLSANQKTLQNLGCSFDDENLNSLFPHPANSDLYVAAVFDPCHMLKLARNCFSEYQIIVIPGVGKAKWQHIQHLHSKQASEGLRLANKLTQAHINFLNVLILDTLSTALLLQAAFYQLLVFLITCFVYLDTMGDLIK